jgi:hypothetical protein
VYRQLLKLFKPSTKLRSMALLSALMSLPAFSKDKSLYDPIQRLDRLIAECQKASGLTAPDEVRFFLVSLCVHQMLACQYKATDSAVFGSICNLCYSSTPCFWI